MKFRKLIKIPAAIGAAFLIVVLLGVAGCKATRCEKQNPSFPTVERWWR